MAGSASINFDNQTVLVTGAAGGLGLSHAKEFLARGAHVILGDFDPAVEDVAEELGANADFVRCDVTSIHACRAAINQVIDRWGSLDVLVNNAGILCDHTIEKQTDDEWRKVLDVHLNGTRNMTVAAWDALKQSAGCIINTTSASGLYGNFGQTNYSAAKMGIVGFSRSCALEGARHQVRVHCIAPIALTAMTENLWRNERQRVGTEPELVSPVVAYLASEQCRETGLIMAAGGGYMARVAIIESRGAQLRAGEHLDAEWVARNFSAASGMSDWEEPPSVTVALERAFSQ